MQCTKILLPLKTCTPNLCSIVSQIFNKLVNMGIGLDIIIDEFFAKLQINEITYLLALQCTLCKLTLFLKHKPNDICTNVVDIHPRPLS